MSLLRARPSPAWGHAQIAEYPIRLAGFVLQCSRQYFLRDLDGARRLGNECKVAHYFALAFILARILGRFRFGPGGNSLSDSPFRRAVGFGVLHLRLLLEPFTNNRLVLWTQRRVTDISHQIALH
jgi:hypothetical protein